MAALTAAQIELAKSLTQDDLPTKLRCAVCSKLAVNAFRLPCCETAICDSCQSTLPSSCPVCEHSPVSGTDCTVYKSLRTTVKVFLKTEEKKREAAQPKINGSKESTPVQPTPIATPVQIQAPTKPPATELPKPTPITEQKPSLAETEVLATPAEHHNLEDAPNAEDKDQPQQDTEIDDTTLNHPTEDSEVKALAIQGQESTELDLKPADNEGNDADTKDTEQTGSNMGYDPINGNYNSNFAGGDFNQMQMMMAMQNGMNPGSFGSFPMMGMMDLMAMQNMMMNGGFGAMGMNGMNMNMGMDMNGFSGGSSDWSGQQSWNVGQDNFNPNAHAMGNGDFGNFNNGPRTGNYGHYNQFNEYRRGGYGFRGRSRSRGFNGGYNGGYHHGYNNHNAGWAEQVSQYTSANDGQPETTPIQANGSKSGKVDEFGRMVRPDSKEVEQPEHQDGQSAAEGNHDDPVPDDKDDGLTSKRPGSVIKEPISASGEVGPDPPTDHDGVLVGDSRTGTQDHINGNPIPTTLATQNPIPDVPLNAPTGPKAMRQGLPNTSLQHLKARGYIVNEANSSADTNRGTVVSPVAERPRSRSSSLRSRHDSGRHHRERSREREEDGKQSKREHDRGRGRSASRSVSRSRSRSRSRVRKESRRHRRHRSPSLSGDAREDDRQRRKRRDKQSSMSEDHKERPREDRHDERSRSASPVDRDHRRLSHRNHRDRDDKRRDREKDRDRETDYDRHRRSSHRSRRERDHEREGDRGRDRDEKARGKDRDRDHGKDRTRDRHDEHRHRGSRNSTAPPTPVESTEKSFNPPTGPRGSFSIKGSSNKPSAHALEARNGVTGPKPPRRDSEVSRRASQPSTKPSAPAKDPHTLEREARDRERLLKEAQRIAGLVGRAGAKRGRDGADDGGGRRKSRRSEATNAEDEESRMRRLEAERENGRWD